MSKVSIVSSWSMFDVRMLVQRSRKANHVHAGADAIAVTGSVISAPPPLRQCDKGGYYKHPDATVALEEAQV